MSVDAGLDVTEVQIVIDGALYSAPSGSTKPTSATAALAAPFVGHGFWSSAGKTESSAKTTTKIRAFQQNTLVASPVTEGEAMTKLVLLQENPDNAALFYGEAVDALAGSVSWNPGRANGRRVFVVDEIVSLTSVRRIVGDGEVTAMDDRVTTYGNVSGYGITITWYGEPVIYNTEWIA